MASRRRGTEVVLLIQCGVETGNHFDGKDAKIITLATANGDELFFRHSVGPQDVLGAFSSDYGRLCRQCEMGNI